MNDLEICKRIAEIKKIHVSNAECGMYDPLAKTETGKALCFDLMIEHNIELTPMFSGGWCASSVKVYTFDEQVDYKLCPAWTDTDPQKAVCLAIIEADEAKKKTTWLRDSNTHSNKGK